MSPNHLEFDRAVDELKSERPSDERRNRSLNAILKPRRPGIKLPGIAAAPDEQNLAGTCNPPKLGVLCRFGDSVLPCGAVHSRADPSSGQNVSSVSDRLESALRHPVSDAVVHVLCARRTSHAKAFWHA